MMTEEKKDPKKWAKLNIEPQNLKIIKRIAIDEEVHIYQLIENIFRDKYPEYFRGTKRC